jgi:hypothetical protein
VLGVSDDAQGWALIAAAGCGLGFVYFVAAFVRATLRRRHLQSGNVMLVQRAAQAEVETWQAPVSYKGFALVALGEFGAARISFLARAPSEGLVARDYCLCSEVLMSAFESQPERSLEFARQLVELPLEGDRHHARRLAVVSVARVLAGVQEEEDWEHLCHAAAYEPVLYWPCRYAAARALYQKGCAALASSLIARAPVWPPSSYFAQLHAQLAPYLRSPPIYPGVA